MEVLVLRCDGMIKNKNVPKKVIQLLIEYKYKNGFIRSRKTYIAYNLNTFRLLVNFYLFIYYLHIIYILFTHYSHIVYILFTHIAWFMLLASSTTSSKKKSNKKYEI